MAKPSQKPATYEQLKALPDNMVGEILDGELVATPRPASPHANAALEAIFDLKGPFDRGIGGPGGWVFLYEPELHLRGGNVLVPDLAGWRRERMPVLPNVTAFELAPDWVCEVLSPSTRKFDRGPKRQIYARESVSFLWLVDVDDHALEAFRLEGSQWKLVGAYMDDTKARIEPFAEIELDLSRWWLPGAP